MTATGGGSGNPVIFSVDPSSTSGTCTLAPSPTVVFSGAGTCVIDANQAGNEGYAPARQAQQVVEISKASQGISFTSLSLSPVTYGSAPLYIPSATGGSSGNPVAFSIDGTSTSGACQLTGTAVDFTGAGTCVLDADQAGNANYTAAPTAQQSIAVGRAGQAVNFVSTPPAEVFGSTSTYQVSATGGGSGTPVLLSIDASSSPGTCTLTGTAVSFSGAGTCVIDANQGGTPDFLPAAQAQQPVAVAKADQSVIFVSSPPPSATPGATYTVGATGGGSGNPVAFTIDPASSTFACTITGSTVHLTSLGTCVVDANQAGGTDYNAAPQVQQRIGIGVPPGAPAPPVTAPPLPGSGPAPTGDVQARPQGGALSPPLVAGNGLAVVPGGTGYWTVNPRTGVLHAYGSARLYSQKTPTAVAVAATPSGEGYWLADSAGGVRAFGDAGSCGSLAGKRLAGPVTCIAASPAGRGYWLVGADGGVFAFGDAHFYGSMAHVRLRGRVTGVMSGPGGSGYWLVGADGGVFAFGQAHFYGSLGNRPAITGTVGLFSTATGYDLVTESGSTSFAPSR